MQNEPFHLNIYIVHDVSLMANLATQQLRIIIMLFFGNAKNTTRAQENRFLKLGWY